MEILLSVFNTNFHSFYLLQMEIKNMEYFCTFYFQIHK